VVARSVRTMAAARRRARGNNGSGGFGALIVALIVIGIIVKFFWWILGALALVGLSFAVAAIIKKHHQRRDALARYHAAIAARADQQHSWVMLGDDRGIYGPQGAELMRYIRAGAAQPAPTIQPPVARWRMGPFGTRFQADV
jgi:hypothetical protein